ncbi:hypothetical protein KFE25_006423 [Diacronema lutheri]|uniref:Parafibromin n=1 Tax=Diacronema lutheri TaxID=2081491 RepID=A0A8J5XKW1_DIALT|nr:hypothetical protein KFE25_006423 [Diacronema lutheri]
MDPLSLLREHHTANKPVMLQGEHLVFGALRIPRDTPTAYRSQQGAFYAIDQLWFYLQNAKMSHAQYLVACNKNKIRGVSLPDKRDLLAYLSGQTDSSAAVDFANAPLIGDVVASAAAEQPAHKRQRGADAPRDELGDARARELAAEARALVAAALDSPALLPAPPPTPLGGGVGGETGVPAAAGAPAAAPAADDEPGAIRGGARAGRRPAPMPSGEALDALIRTDLADVELVLERELRAASRSSQLIAPSRKAFAPRVEQILATLREQAARATAARAPPPPPLAAAAAAGLRPASNGAARRPGKPGAPPPAGAARASAAPPQPPPLIIVVPAQASCTINMWNAADFIVRGTFVPTSDKRKNPANKKDAHVRHTHKLSTGLSLRFEIIDNVATLGKADWERVVAVFVQGTSWEFKSWPFKDTVATFANVRGFYVRFTDQVPPPSILASDVKTLILSQDKRYMDSTVAKDFWHALEKFLLCQKRALLGLQ